MEFSAKELNNGFNIVNGHIEMFTMKLLQVTYFIHRENPLSLIIYPLEWPYKKQFVGVHLQILKWITLTKTA